MENRKKTTEYQNYWLPDVKRFWLVNTETKLTSHMIEVDFGQPHDNRQPDGTPKWKLKYPILVLYRLDKPFLPNSDRLVCKRPSGPIIMKRPDIALTKIWAIRDNHL
jgi:hypothetical protein